MSDSPANKIIVTHVFVGEHDHLSFPTMGSICAHSSLGHQFVILNPGGKRAKYIEWFASRGIDGYLFVDNHSQPLRGSRFLFLRRVGIYLQPTLSFMNLVRIARFSRGRLFLHGLDFNLPMLVLSRLLGVHVGFICWGYIEPRRTSQFQNRLLAWNYSLYKTIVCLMVPDKERLERAFGCKNVVCQHYLYETPRQFDCPDVDACEHVSPTVVVGNSSYSIDVYPEVLGRLPWDRLGRVICMLNYGNESRSAEINQFAKHNANAFGAKFFPWREKVDYETYCRTIAPASCYLSPLKTQTGLGICYLMLKWGRKVYVKGANLAWLRRCGFVVFDLDAVDLSTVDDLLSPLSPEDLARNSEAWARLFDIGQNAEKWDKIFLLEKR